MCSGTFQKLFEIINHFITELRNIFVDNIFHTCYNYIFIIRAVKYLNHSLSRSMLMYPPEKIMGKLFFSGDFKGRYINTHRVYFLKYIFNSSVFPACIKSLENYQKASFILCE